MSSSEILEKLKALVEPVIITQGMELVDIEWRRESHGWVLRLYIDKEGGVGLDDCSSVSQEVSLILDVEDIIEQAYTLEVSSPGINRALKGACDFEKFIGKRAKIKTKNPINERRNFKGLLVKLQDDVVTILVNGDQINIPLPEIEKANLDIL